jgi:hypothetical protein
MRCWECGLEFDEMNESQRFCPGCEAWPRCRGDDLEFSAILDESSAIAVLGDTEAPEDESLDIDPVLGPAALPVDLQEAAEEGEGLLEATAYGPKTGSD